MEMAAISINFDYFVMIMWKPRDCHCHDVSLGFFVDCWELLRHEWCFCKKSNELELI